MLSKRFKSTHILLGLSTFLFAYSLNETTKLWYTILLGIAVVVYYSFPRTSVMMRVYVLFGLCLVLTWICTSNRILVFPFLCAMVLTISYPWFREIPWMKTPIIASSWTLFMSASTALNLVSIMVLLLLFGVLATASDVKDRETDPIRLKTIPQVLTWPILRWVLFSVIGIMLGLTFLFLHNWLLGAILFSAFFTSVMIRNWNMPKDFDLDPGLLLFALGNLLYLH